MMRCYGILLDWTNDPYFDIQCGKISIFFKLLHMSVLAIDAKYENSLTYSDCVRKYNNILI